MQSTITILVAYGVTGNFAIQSAKLVYCTQLFSSKSFPYIKRSLNELNYLRLTSIHTLPILILQNKSMPFNTFSKSSPNSNKMIISKFQCLDYPSLNHNLFSIILVYLKVCMAFSIHRLNIKGGRIASFLTDSFMNCSFFLSSIDFITALWFSYRLYKILTYKYIISVTFRISNNLHQLTLSKAFQELPIPNQWGYISICCLLRAVSELIYFFYQQSDPYPIKFYLLFYSSKNYLPENFIGITHQTNHAIVVFTQM